MYAWFGLKTYHPRVGNVRLKLPIAIYPERPSNDSNKSHHRHHNGVLKHTRYVKVQKFWAHLPRLKEAFWWTDVLLLFPVPQDFSCFDGPSQES